MIPELVPVWRRWEETHAALLDCLEQFPEDRFLSRPAPGTTTASEIVTHIARAEIQYATRACDAAGEPPAIRYAADPGDPGLAVVDRGSAVEVAEAAARFALGAVERLSSEDLNRCVASEWFPLGPRVEGPLTALWFVEQMNRHKAYHLGQLWYVRMWLSPEPGR